MGIVLGLLIFLLQVLLPAWGSWDGISQYSTKSTSPFPNNFLFGTASSAYQVEGAFSDDGKGLNNWDIFSHTPDRIMDASNGDVAVDQYHRYLEDIELMSSLGVNSYRFSISWARILPRGMFGNINLAGIEHYNNLIDALILKGIEPFVTLSHYDIPQELEDRYGSWLNPQIQLDFGFFADLCFREFGDRVKYWVTFNEPNIIAIQAYRAGIYPPARCSVPFGNCTFGDSTEEPFVAAHNIILSHALAVDIYRSKYQKEQGGSIGIVMNAIWFEPISNSTEDIAAAQRALSFLLNWFLDPIVFGTYPVEMYEILGTSLPTFSQNDQKKLHDGLDFIGINHYTSLYAKDCMFSACEFGMGSSRTEGYAQQTGQKAGINIGETTSMAYYYVYPEGMEKMIMYLKERYNNIPIFVAENGYPDENDPNAPIEFFLYDDNRVKYMRSYLDALVRAIRKGADVRGYFTWSLLDNFEWIFGYTKRFGLYHVDFTTLKRTPKFSATWYKQFIAEHKGIKSTISESAQNIQNIAEKTQLQTN
ncbi:hypothetical protein MRB53_028453 [Persea americana]|uniref:Uncharacterized protein n=1 Tax=Persea americana TaxID=3435 RepID=A0ACC2KFL6_PERAE|nr:hypothetical protein MRB53_028453 [Persea americana]